MDTVKQILDRKGTDVWSTSPDVSVFEALELLKEKNVGALLVLDEAERLVGIFSERDYARKVILQGKSSKGTAVREVVTRRVLCVSAARTVDECMALMSSKHIRHLPVVEAGGRVVGIVSIGDIVKAVIRQQQFIIEQLEHYISGV